MLESSGSLEPDSEPEEEEETDNADSPDVEHMWDMSVLFTFV